MGSLNQFTGIGNLGRDAELRYTPGGVGVATFSIACTETWRDKDSGEKKERTEWVRCVLWGKRAEALTEYLTKGKQVAVVGKLQTRKWQDKDGHDKYTTEVRLDDVVLLGGGGRRDDDEGGGERRERPQRQGGGKQADPDDAPIDDDVPFAWVLPMLMPLAGTGLAMLSGGGLA